MHSSFEKCSGRRLATWSFDGCGLPPIALACIDEAHCVSEWSHNFRPDYLRLHEYVVGALGAKRVLALTATATRPTVKSVCDILRLDTVVRSDRSFTVEELMQEPTQPTVQRSNLTMDVRSVPDAEFQVRELINILRNEVGPSESVVVYVWRRATADQLAKQLRPYVRGGVNAYHGSMLADVRSTVQENFMSGKVLVEQHVLFEGVSQNSDHVCKRQAHSSQGYMPSEEMVRTQAFLKWSPHLDADYNYISIL